MKQACGDAKLHAALATNSELELWASVADLGSPAFWFGSLI